MAYNLKQPKQKEKNTFPFSRDEIEKKQYYVTMTDKFMSGWGQAEGKTNKFVVGCDTWEEAEEIKRNAEKRPEMKYINISSKKPYYKQSAVKTSYRNYNELSGNWKDKREYVEGVGWRDKI